MGNQYCIIRCDRAGVFAGTLKERNGREVTLTNARRLWRWYGALTISDLAVEGTTDPGHCSFTLEVPEITLLEAIEIVPCSAEAEKSIREVPVWKM